MVKDKKKKSKPKKQRLTLKMRKFAELYEGEGTGSDTAEKAGYKGTPGSLRVTACRLLTNANVWALIKKRQEAEKSARIADRTEREERLSEILRNDRAYKIEIEKTRQEIIKIDVENRDTIKAIDTLNKMDGIYVTKHEVAGKDGESFDFNLKVTFVEPKKET